MEEWRCVLAVGRFSIHVGYGVGHTYHSLTAWCGATSSGSGLPEGSLMVWDAVGISSRVCLGYWVPVGSEMLPRGCWDLDLGSRLRT